MCLYTDIKRLSKLRVARVIASRVQSYIKNGWAGEIINPGEISGASNVINTDEPTAANKCPSAVSDWKDLRSAFTCPNEVPSFSNGQMVTYFVSRTVCDGLPAGDFKSMNIATKRLYDCGHVQCIQVGSSSTHLFIRANCLPEMKKNVQYKIIMSLQNKSCDIDTAECGCKAGKRPKASCKHMGAMCCALAEFCKSGRQPNFLTCTDGLQEWNRPTPRRVEAIPVLELGSCRQEILKKQSRRPVPSQYDPRPLSVCSPDPGLMERLRVDLLTVNKSVFTQLLLPPLEVALHDHNYANAHVNMSVAMSTPTIADLPDKTQMVLLQMGGKISFSRNLMLHMKRERKN